MPLYQISCTSKHAVVSSVWCKECSPDVPRYSMPSYTLGNTQDALETRTSTRALRMAKDPCRITDIPQMVGPDRRAQLRRTRSENRQASQIASHARGTQEPTGVNTARAWDNKRDHRDLGAQHLTNIYGTLICLAAVRARKPVKATLRNRVS